ncbi:reverse transcriptase domain protein [Colletotrichum kahawae]|uniref:Reverse transcriptase domain protein n=1 Tax=Colletotrichum kahawae TaxID=34407 RepID=A0AAD9XZF2_COLKA|nr:reverse transcriptase domain protein [Colletotrichum kahawae]
MENLRIQTLSSDEDWNKWLPNLKLVARSKEVWDYINPDQDLVLTEPEERWPDVEDPQFINKIAIARIQYNREIDRYEKRKKAVSEVTQWAMGIIDKAVFNRVNSRETLREMLRDLRETFAPTAFSR